MGKSTVEDFQNDGFEVYNEKPKVAKSAKAPDKSPAKFSKNTSKIIIMDNKEVLSAVKESNKMMEAGLRKANEALQAGLEQLVYEIGSKPDSFTLDIERDHRGFMKSIKVKINK